jgi:hypothetical protein
MPPWPIGRSSRVGPELKPGQAGLNRGGEEAAPVGYCLSVEERAKVAGQFGGVAGQLLEPATPLVRIEVKRGVQQRLQGLPAVVI